MKISNVSNSKSQNSCINNQINFKAGVNMLEIKGAQTSAKIFAISIDYKALNQIKELCNHPIFKDAPIRIMPDVHPSRNTIVGFSAPVLNSKVIPSIIGSDVGCGMLCVKFDTQGQKIDFKKLDRIVKESFSHDRTSTPQYLKRIPKTLKDRLNNICKELYKTNGDEHISRLGTVGGGNHFIEIDKDKQGGQYLIIHTGSRILGKKFAEHHQFISRRQNHYFIKELSYLSGDEAHKYLNDMEIIQKYAEINRRTIANEILYRMGWKEQDSFESVHNYISKDGMIRKGAIDASAGKPVIIPLNMRDGVILGTGKGNPDWNYTAPHGAGRKLSRSMAAQTISMDDFSDAMKGIYTSSIRKGTLDEAPQAYKNAEEIIENIGQTTEIKEVIKPIYNYKE